MRKAILYKVLQNLEAIKLIETYMSHFFSYNTSASSGMPFALQNLEAIKLIETKEYVRFHRTSQIELQNLEAIKLIETVKKELGISAKISFLLQNLEAIKLIEWKKS